MSILITLLASVGAFAGDADAIHAAADLPSAAQDLRDQGVSRVDVEVALDAARDADIGAGDFSGILDDAAYEVRIHGPIDEFGRFVRDCIREGMRGGDLASAIVAEHEARGLGEQRQLEDDDRTPGVPRAHDDDGVHGGVMTRPGGGMTRPGTTRPRRGEKNAGDGMQRPE